MGELTAEVDAAEAGFDPVRLRQIDAHFARYVDDGRLAGWLLTVSRNGRLAHVSSCGQRDMEAGLPVTVDTLWRIYSMTKPLTSAAVMMLYEEGALALTDPVSAFIPSFADVRVYAGGSDLRPLTVPATEPVRIWHLLTHTAGLTYGFHRVDPVDALYRSAGFEVGTPRGVDLAQACDTWAGIPLLFQPGTEWNYSVATDVLGRVVEVVSGRSLEEFFATRILGPLGMTDTTFWVGDEDAGRLATLYLRAADGTLAEAELLGKAARKRPVMFSGGGGLVSGQAESFGVRAAARVVRGGGGPCTWAGALACLMGVPPADRRGQAIGSALGAALFGGWMIVEAVAVLRETDEVKEAAAKGLFAASISYLFVLFAALIAGHFLGIAPFGAASFGAWM